MNTLLIAKLSELTIALVLLSSSLETVIPSKVIEIENTQGMTIIAPNNPDSVKKEITSVRGNFSDLNAIGSSTKDAVKALILLKSEEHGVDPNLVLAIVKCESEFKRFAKSPSSSAESYFQFINSTWQQTMSKMGYPTSTPKTQMPEAIEAGIWLLANSGDHHWSESKPCWSKELSMK